MMQRSESRWRREAGLLICGAVVVPIAFIVVYPWFFLLLPERRQILADMPQELLMLLLAEAVLLPVLLLGAYIRGRRRT
jgi:hypothetical protein